MHLELFPALAFLLLSSFDPTTAYSLGPKYQAGRELISPLDTAIRLAREIPGASSSKNGDELQHESSNSVDSKVSNPKSEERNASVGAEGTSSSGIYFGYLDDNGPYTWANNFPMCGGRRQSPININLEKTMRPPLGIDSNIYFKFYDKQAQEMSLVNTGHSLRLNGKWNGEIPTIKGGVLNGEYAWQEIHFHWGEDDEEGSEHLINGESYAMAMHVIHYKQAYGSFDAAKLYDDGLAVVTYLFQMQEQKNLALERLIDVSSQLRNPGNAITMSPFPINKLAPQFNRNYASYEGSLTTPPCSEIVTWIIRLKPLGVSESQLQNLRKLRDLSGKQLMKNCRPVQCLNNRVTRYVPKNNDCC